VSFPVRVFAYRPVQVTCSHNDRRLTALLCDSENLKELVL